MTSDVGRGFEHHRLLDQPLGCLILRSGAASRASSVRSLALATQAAWAVCMETLSRQSLTLPNISLSLGKGWLGVVLSPALQLGNLAQAGPSRSPSLSFPFCKMQKTTNCFSVSLKETRFAIAYLCTRGPGVGQG